MRYRKLTIENFLVFKGEQTISFPEKDGVVVFYGRNGKGKTSLLNAFRWAWTGEVRKRSTRTLPLEDITNQVALEETNSDSLRCRVRLEFEVDGVQWDLTRTLATTGQGLSTDLTLRRAAVALSTADAERRVAELMPREIEQFFLFDGELLDQYEKLLDDDSTAGSTLRDAIERILGLPILENAARDSSRVAEDAGRLIADAAKRDNKTEKLGQYLAGEQTRLQAFRDNFEAEDRKVKELEAESRQLEQQVAEQSGKLEIKAKRDEVLERLKDAETRYEAAKQEFEELLADSWRAVLVEPIAARIEQDDKELESLENRLGGLRFAAVLARHYKASGDDTCPVCESHLGDDNRAALEQHLRETDSDELEAAEDQAATLKSSLKQLRASGTGYELRANLKIVEDTYLKLQQEIEDYRDDLDDLNDNLKGRDGELTELIQRTTNVAKLLEKAKTAYKDERARWEQARVNVDKFEMEIRKTGAGQADPTIYLRKQTAEGLAALYEKAIVIYRDQLKEQIQERGTELFQSMRSESDYVKLAINESYGLRILDRSGQAVTHRSAGYEHLVALSLLGGLQASAPITGPLVMDSPFGRLDEQHVEGVVANLDKLSSQVFLLVHERELPRDAARDLLRGRLLAEFELSRGSSARETNIQELRQ
ncbi:AAA family ATPase [uncultured Kocuria sp.]|uniref:AAA family ATPase n=1 Tax=uncultured Kocuria sp. TaxID=259305 RepID=UPI002624743D|nr:AAA family ATPase [uncultured Kocuria sp.]